MQQDCQLFAKGYLNPSRVKTNCLNMFDHFVELALKGLRRLTFGYASDQYIFKTIEATGANSL